MATSHSNRGFQTPADAHIERFDYGKVELHGHQLYWERYGDQQDPCVLFLHHGLGSIRSWRRQAPAFVRAGWQVLAYDRWGYGRSDERPSFEYGYLAKDTEEAFQFLEMLKIKELALVGHSDGGSIALLMASEQPARITAMVVVAAHIYFEPLMVGGLDLIEQSTTEPGLIEALEREHGERASRLVRAWVDHWRSTDPHSLNMQDHLAAITCPTLVIQGELDEHATPQHAVDIAEGVQDGHLWLIPKVKHMPPHEIPDLFNNRVLEFLAESGA
jgi:pimeloyl-ACP methyl ester carboxylesterase